MTRVTIQTSQEATGSDSGAGILAEVRAIVADFGVTLEPMHRDIAHPLLSRFFVADVGEPERAQELIQRLLQHPHVEAAYISPMPELPGIALR